MMLAPNPTPLFPPWPSSSHARLKNHRQLFAKNRGSRRHGAGSPPSRNDSGARRARAPPPVEGGPRQRHGRGSSRPCDAHSSRARLRQWVRVATTAAAFRSIPSPGPEEIARNDPDHPHPAAKSSADAYKTRGAPRCGVSVVNALSDEIEGRGPHGDRQLWARAIDAAYRGRRLEPWARCTIGADDRALPPRTRDLRRTSPLRPATLYGWRAPRPISSRMNSVELEQSDPGGEASGEDRPTSMCGSAIPSASLNGRAMLTPRPFLGRSISRKAAASNGPWAAWPEEEEEGFSQAYCNTIPTPKRHPRADAQRSVTSIIGVWRVVGNSRIPQTTGEGRHPGTATLLRCHPRPAVSGAEKGAAASSEATQARRKRRQGPISTIG